jgi:hypothetical protein
MVCTSHPVFRLLQRLATIMSKRFRINVNRYWSHRASRGLAAASVIVTICALIVGSASSYSSVHHPVARAAQSLNATTTAHLHLVKAEGSELFEAGAVSGSLPGSMQAELKTGAVYTGSFTTHTHGGSIKGRGTATPHGAGRYQSFKGTFIVTGGTGRYAHVRGRAGLYGVFDCRTDGVTVQTTGKLSY